MRLAQLPLLQDVAQRLLHTNGHTNGTDAGPDRRSSVFVAEHSGTVVQALFELHFPISTRVLDMTYGKGTFWKWDWSRVDHRVDITAIDVDPQVDVAVQMDARHTTFEDHSFQVIAIDPPFMHGAKMDRNTSMRGTYTGTIKAMDRDYSHMRSQKEIIELYRGMIMEARRLVEEGANGCGVIVKCKDSIEHGDYIEVTRHVSEALEFHEFRVVDKALILPANQLPVDEDDAVRHLRRQESYFFVAKPKRRRG